MGIILEIESNGYGGYYISRKGKGWHVYCTGSQWVAKGNLDNEQEDYTSSALDEVIDWCMEQFY